AGDRALLAAAAANRFVVLLGCALIVEVIADLLAILLDLDDRLAGACFLQLALGAEDVALERDFLLVGRLQAGSQDATDRQDECQRPHVSHRRPPLNWDRGQDGRTTRSSGSLLWTRRIGEIFNGPRPGLIAKAGRAGPGGVAELLLPTWR